MEKNNTRKEFELQDLGCVNYVAKTEETIKKTEGVSDVTVSSMVRKMTIEVGDGRFDEIMEEVVSVYRKVEPDCVTLP